MKTILNTFLFCLLVQLCFAQNKIFNDDTNKTKAHYQKGLNFLSQKQYRSAILEFDSAIKINPNYTEAYDERGNAKFDGSIFTKDDSVLSQFDTTWAWGDYSKAIALNPKFAKAYYDRGIRTAILANQVPSTWGHPDIFKAIELGYPVKAVQDSNHIGIYFISTTH